MRRVFWLHRSSVYHVRARRGDAVCGVPISTDRYRAKESTEAGAQSLGLRPCKRCQTYRMAF